jgi:hypothetical protein
MVPQSYDLTVREIPEARLQVQDVTRMSPALQNHGAEALEVVDSSWLHQPLGGRAAMQNAIYL